MKNILFATDFSPIAENAFIYALMMANELECGIDTIHVYSLPDISNVSLPNTLRGIYESIEMEQFENYKDAVPRLNEFAARHNMSHVDMNHILIEGNPAEVIVKYARNQGYEMIIMGKKGSTGLVSVFIGSVAAKVMSNSNVPVFVIPKDSHFDGVINNLAFATECSNKEFEAFKRTIKFARQLNAKIHCIHSTERYHDELDEKMITWKAGTTTDYKNISYKIIEGSDPEESIVQYCKDNKVDAIVLVTKKKSSFVELFGYSLTKTMVNKYKMPIIAIPEGSLTDEAT